MWLKVQIMNDIIRTIVQITPFQKRPFVMLAVLAAGWCIGCGPGNPLGRQAVSGKVALDGIALDSGLIEFSPVSDKGVAAGAIIENGAYNIPEIKGLPPGKYLVRITSSTFGPSRNPSDRSTALPSNTALPRKGIACTPGKQRIAAQYNKESQLTAEVIAGQSATFDFNTTSKG
jgi:hypothetical protein